MFERDEYENASLYAAGILCEEEASEPFAPIKRKETTDRKSEVQKALELVYGNMETGYVAVFEKNIVTGSKKQSFIEAKDAVLTLSKKEIDKDTHTYIGRNLFRTKCSKKSCIQGLYNVGIDIDCHKESVSQQELLNLVTVLKSEFKLSWCSIVSYSGRGIHLWWHIKKLDNKTYGFMYRTIVLQLIMEIQAVLKTHEELQKFKVDKDASLNEAGMLRLFGSYNPEAKTYVTFEICESIYDLEELGDISGILKKQNSRPIKYYDSASKESFKPQLEKRLAMIEGLISHRDGWGEGFRHNYLFMYHATAFGLLGKDKARKKAEELNRCFKPALADVLDLFHYNERRDMKFSNAYIIEFLGINEEEQDLFNFYVAGTCGSYTQTLEDREVAKQKREAKMQRNEDIVLLYLQGSSYESIAQKTGCTKGTVCNVVNKCSKAEKTCHNIQILKIKGLTQNEVSKKLKVSVTTVQKYWNTKGLDKVKKIFCLKTL